MQKFGLFYVSQWHRSVQSLCSKAFNRDAYKSNDVEWLGEIYDLWIHCAQWHSQAKFFVRPIFLNEEHCMCAVSGFRVIITWSNSFKRLLLPFCDKAENDACTSCRLWTQTKLLITRFPFADCCFVVPVPKGPRGLGLSVCGGIDTTAAFPGLIRIKRLFPNQSAWCTGMLQPGDILLKANGIPLTGLTNHVIMHITSLQVGSLHCQQQKIQILHFILHV